MAGTISQVRQKESILVIGGTKFIGLHLVHRLVENGYDVTVFNIEKSIINLPATVKHIQGDRTDYTKVIDRLPKDSYDIVFDTCGFFPGDVNIFIQHFKAKIKQYIFISSISVYNTNYFNNTPIEEDSLLYNDLEYHCYETNKVFCEKQLLNNPYFPVTIIRPAFLYGPYAYDYRIEYFFDRIKEEQIIFVPDTQDLIIHYIYINDLIDLLMSVIINQKAFSNVFNAAGNEAIRIYNLINICEAIIGKKANIRIYDSQKIKSLLTEEEQQKIIPPRIFNYSLYFSIKKANRLLSWQPRFTMKDGLAATYDWDQKYRKKVFDFSREPDIYAKLIEAQIIK
jgi:nucleoside-diphosphate-sugar epimerase